MELQNIDRRTRKLLPIHDLHATTLWRGKLGIIVQEKKGVVDLLGVTDVQLEEIERVSLDANLGDLEIFKYKYRKKSMSCYRP